MNGSVNAHDYYLTMISCFMIYHHCYHFAIVLLVVIVIIIRNAHHPQQTFIELLQ